MAIPEAQLETWSHQGSITQSSTTYQTIRNALMSSNASYSSKSYDVFLQGSYGNDTNIYAESDVDIVIRLDAIFNYKIDHLQPNQQTAFKQAFSGSAGYTFAEFKKGVSERLSAAFGADVEPGTKAVRIKANGSRRSADVLVCYQHRRYTEFLSLNDNAYIPGIMFFTSEGENVINYPKAHSENCTIKHQATNSWFKPMVRIMKNMRSQLVKTGAMAQGVAPSYYIEGMLYSVPNEKFGKSYANTFADCVTWLMTTDRSKLMCANRQYWLLGNSQVQWTDANCTLFLRMLAALWNNW